MRARLLPALLLLLIAGCSAPVSTPTAPSTPTVMPATPTVVPTASAMASPTPSPTISSPGEAPSGDEESGPQGAPTSTAGGSGASLPAGVFAGAGGPRPGDAVLITSVRKPTTQYETEVAYIKSPTGNIGCEFFVDGSGGCGVISYMEEAKYGEEWTGPNWWFVLGGEGAPVIGSKSDAPYFDHDSPKAMRPAYGTTVYYNNFVCHSAEAGLTCWDTNTGHGVFLRRAGYEAF